MISDFAQAADGTLDAAIMEPVMQPPQEQAPQDYPVRTGDINGIALL